MLFRSRATGTVNRILPLPRRRVVALSLTPHLLYTKGVLNADGDRYERSHEPSYLLLSAPQEGGHAYVYYQPERERNRLGFD